MKIINKYIIKNFINNFFVYFVISTILLLLNYLYQIINSLIVHKTDLIIAVKLCLFLIPSVFSLTIPIAILTSVLLTFSTLNETRELVTIQTMGVRKSFYTINFIFLSILLTIIVFYFNTTFVPKSYRTFRKTFINYVIAKPTINFNNNLISIKNKKIAYKKIVEQKENKFSLTNIYIFSPIENTNIIQTIYAKRADVYSDINSNIIFNLQNGKIIIFEKTLSTQITYLDFNEYKFIIYSDQINKIVSESTNLRELTNKELKCEFEKTNILNYKKYILSEYFLRYTISLSIIVFMIIGILIGTKIRKNAKPLSFIFTIVFVLVYYFLLIGSISVIENANFNPKFTTAAIIMQMPNIFSLILAYVLYIMI